MPVISRAEFTNLPEWLQEPYKNLVLEAERLRQVPPSAYEYQEPRLAGIPADIMRAHEMTREMMGGYGPSIAESEERLRQSSTPFTARFQEYMNPYQQAVVRQIAEEGKRSFTEDILPQLEAKFVRLGQHGSSRHADLARRAARDLEKEVLDRQARAMSEGYQQAAQIFSADQARAIETAREMANLAAVRQGSSLADIAALEAQGRYQQQQEQAQKDIAYQDFLRRKEHPSQSLSWQAALMHGIPAGGMNVGYTQQPGVPQMNTLGNIGSIAGNILAARMAAGR